MRAAVHGRALLPRAGDMPPPTSQARSSPCGIHLGLHCTSPLRADLRGCPDRAEADWERLVRAELRRERIGGGVPTSDIAENVPTSLGHNTSTRTSTMFYAPPTRSRTMSPPSPESPHVLERHFNDLQKNYGPVLVVDLVNTNGGEGRLFERYAKSIELFSRMIYDMCILPSIVLWLYSFQAAFSAL